LVVAFCWAKGFRKVETWVVATVIVFLKENSSSSDKGGVSGDSKLLLRIRITENRGNTEGFFDFIESFFLGL